MSAAQPGELREALTEALDGVWRDALGISPGTDAAADAFDGVRQVYLHALLPVVTAYAERLARERAAEELRAAADVRWADRVRWAEVRADLHRRADALTADDQSVQP